MEKITIGDLLDQTTELYPNNDALVYVTPPVRYSYQEFRNTCNQMAKGLMKIGIDKNENVAIWANNVPEWSIAQFAMAKMGAILVTVNTNYRAFELEYLLKQSDSTTLILIEGIRGREYLDIIYELCPELNKCEPGCLEAQRLPLLKNVIYIGEQKMPGMYSWQDIFDMGNSVHDAELQQRQSSLNADEVINMQYTSGTTGFPKGVMLSHNNIVGNAKSIVERLSLSHEDRLCIPVPFFHCFGCVLGTLTCVVSGATMVPVVSFDPIKVLQTVAQEKCTALHGVPTMFIAELEAMSQNKYDTSSLRTGVMGGSPCPIEVMKSVINEMGVTEICIAYGLTESSPVITMTTATDPIEKRVSTVGKAMPNVEVKIIDPKTQQIMPPGVQGELCTRGYLVMKGYYKMEDMTHIAIDKDKWLRTGDLAIMEADGYCSITGRLKDVIIRGGENIYPKEIEEFLYTHPKIKDVQVVGIPSTKYGEEVAAFIQKREEDLSEQDVKEFCKEKISYHKIPKHIFFLSEYPTTASGKIQKFKLREIAMELLK